MLVIADAGPLIALARIEHLSLLPTLFEQIQIPDAVHEEVVIGGTGRPGSEAVREADWVRTGHVHDRVGVDLLRDRMAAGESEALVLAIETNADLLLIDEERGRRVAESRGITSTGTLGVLLMAKKRAILAAVRPCLDKLTAAGFRMDQTLYKKVCELAGEADH
jgi:predicted nucleic acid-binding protein